MSMITDMNPDFLYAACALTGGLHAWLDTADGLAAARARPAIRLLETMLADGGLEPVPARPVDPDHAVRAAGVLRERALAAGDLPALRFADTALNHLTVVNA